MFIEDFHDISGCSRMFLECFFLCKTFDRQNFSQGKIYFEYI